MKTLTATILVLLIAAPALAGAPKAEKAYRWEMAASTNTAELDLGDRWPTRQQALEFAVGRYAAITWTVNQTEKEHAKNVQWVKAQMDDVEWMWAHTPCPDGYPVQGNEANCFRQVP